jgi:hypothetical protein
MFIEGLLSCNRRSYSVTTASQSMPSYPSTERTALSLSASLAQNSRWPAAPTAASAVPTVVMRTPPLVGSTSVCPGVRLTGAVGRGNKGGVDDIMRSNGSGSSKHDHDHDDDMDVDIDVRRIPLR